ncbi:hypothetical protein [Quadrisphaera sp. DSM 44207]|uniref:hypothetical protein n=1 Tax=Quadrisphaera sp. DSM 44207 TaxID=1881057 RepID=UPI00115FFA49|nr:hypothetical protein [Quadrisphaera sp. DSM 44207]
MSGTYASFTASVSRGHTVTTAVPLLELGATGTAANRLGVDALALAPGDVYRRAFDVTNSGTAAFAAYTVSTTATTSSLLDTDGTNGLQVKLERCSAPWTETGTGPALAYTCPGTTALALPARRVAMTAVPLSGMLSAAPGGTDHMLLTVTLPATADNSFQNQMSAITYTFNGS